MSRGWKARSHWKKCPPASGEAASATYGLVVPAGTLPRHTPGHHSGWACMGESARGALAGRLWPPSPTWRTARGGHIMGFRHWPVSGAWQFGEGQRSAGRNLDSIFISCFFRLWHPPRRRLSSEPSPRLPLGGTWDRGSSHGGRDPSLLPRARLPPGGWSFVKR